MLLSRLGTVSTRRLRLDPRLVLLVPLLLTLLAACGKGTGGGPAY
jgi:hypothetical protein